MDRVKGEMEMGQRFYGLGCGMEKEVRPQGENQQGRERGNKFLFFLFQSFSKIFFKWF